MLPGISSLNRSKILRFAQFEARQSGEGKGGPSGNADKCGQLSMVFLFVLSSLCLRNSNLTKSNFLPVTVTRRTQGLGQKLQLLRFLASRSHTVHAVRLCEYRFNFGEGLGYGLARESRLFTYLLREESRDDREIQTSWVPLLLRTLSLRSNCLRFQL